MLLLRAVKLYGPHDVRLEDVEEPKIEEKRDAIVKVKLTSICGTDMHIYRGHLDVGLGTVTGHEFVGVVEEVGEEVRHVVEGDRVLASCWIADGTCWYCKRGYYTQCVNVNIFGLGPLYGESVQGAHAELVRVPNADLVLSKIPNEVSDEKAVLVSDALPAGYAGVLEGGMEPGDNVVIMGCGPIGLLSGMCADMLGASQVIAVDFIDERLKKAAQLGFITVNAREKDVGEEVRDLTYDRGADVVIEAVGGSSEPLIKAIELARKKGKVSVVGVHLYDYSIPVGQLFVTEKRISFSIGDPIKYRDKLMDYIRHEKIDPSIIITHRLRLEEATKAFEIFDKKEAVKIVMKP